MSGGHPIDSTGQQEPTVGPSTPSGVSPVYVVDCNNPQHWGEIDRLNATISRQWEIINAQKKRPGQRTLIERARNARHENKWLHRRLARAEAEIAKYRAVLNPDEELKDEMVRSVAYQINTDPFLGRAVRAVDAVLADALAALVNPEGGE